MSEKNIDTWWGQDATRILDYIEMYRGHMSDFEVLEDIMCGSYVDEFADHSECDPKVCEHACTRLEKEECEHEWGKSLHEGPLFDEILMICTKCGEYEE